MKQQAKDKLMNQKDIMTLLDTCYDKCLNGIPKVSQSVDKLANDYLEKYVTKDEACKAMLKNQVIKCTTSGFITGFGGLITMPVTLPANITSVIYVQMRMIACTAYLAGYDLDSDQTQTFIYACLAGITINGFLKQAGIKIGMKASNKLIGRIPGKALIAINKSWF